MQKNILLWIVAALLMHVVACKKSNQYKTIATAQPAFTRVVTHTTFTSFHKQLFSGKNNPDKDLLQAGQHGSKQYLLYLNQTALPNLHSYYLIKKMSNGIVTSHRVLSRDEISSTINLSAFVGKNKSLLYYTAKPGQLAKLILKARGIKVTLDEVIDKSPEYFVNKSRPCEQQPPVCIDWYWTTYDVETGEIISEEYVGTTCTKPCAESGGGGGGAPVVAPIPTCQQQLDGFVASGTPLSTKVNVEICGTGPNTRTKCYIWKIFTVSGGLIPMDLTSKERGIQSYLGQNMWQFDSFEHVGVGKSGTQILYSVNAVDMLSTPSLKRSGNNTYYDIAQMHLSFSVEFSIICDGMPVVNRQPASTINTWYVSE